MNVYLFNAEIGQCENMYQPDIIVNCDKNKMTEKGCESSTELVLEIVSKSTASNDCFIKYANYMRYGVKEYWIVDRDKNQIIVYLNNNHDEDEAPTINKYTFSDTVKVNILDDLSIDFNNILALLA